jgi:hypothetical protein
MGWNARRQNHFITSHPEVKSMTLGNRLVLCHYTHRENLFKILTNGLLPQRCEQRRARIWLADSTGCEWALHHVSETHVWQVDEMACVVAIGPKEWFHPVRPGVWCCYSPITPDNLCLMVAAYHPVALQVTLELEKFYQARKEGRRRG